MHEVELVRLSNEGVNLVARRFGGNGYGVLLLHGLAGYGGEWSEVAEELAHGDAFEPFT